MLVDWKAISSFGLPGSAIGVDVLNKYCQVVPGMTSREKDLIAGDRLLVKSSATGRANR
jgi:hypothetical protein